MGVPHKVILASVFENYLLQLENPFFLLWSTGWSNFF